MSDSESRETVTLNTLIFNPLLPVLSHDAPSPQSHLHTPPLVIILSSTGTTCIFAAKGQDSLIFLHIGDTLNLYPMFKSHLQVQNSYWHISVV